MYKGQSIKDKIKFAEKGTKASGGGYGPFTKHGDNDWRSKSGTFMHNDSLWSRIGGFNDFKLY